MNSKYSTTVEGKEIFTVGRPFSEIKHLLNEAGVVYNIVMSKPTKDFFPVAQDELYVIRQRCVEMDGQEGERTSVLELTLAARLQR